MSSYDKTLILGTRGSLLAKTQSEWVAEQLRMAHPGLEIRLQIIQTTGDMNREVPFNQVGAKGMFVKEIEQALLDGSIDFGVHSLKDMPGELPEGLEIVCTPEREDPRDSLLSNNGMKLQELPLNSIVGTSSIRRRFQLKAARPDLDIRELRGNLDTRWRKLQEGQYAAIMLACAGLNRLGWQDRISENLDPLLFVPAAGQGALAIETRAGDSVVSNLLSAIHHEATACEVSAERAFLAELGGGCSVPAGAYAEIEGESMRLVGMFAQSDGDSIQRVTLTGDRSQPEELGKRVANKILER